MTAVGDNDDVRELFDLVRQQGADLAGVRANVESIKDGLDELARVIHLGNGQKPLVVRTAIIEERN